MEQRSRTLTLERKQAQGNTFPATLATEAPVLRFVDGMEVWEVLDMSRLDLSRAPLPVIESHDQSRLNIGIVEDLRVEGDKLRGSIRLGKSARAAEIAEDIRAGIVRSVSVGYQVSDPIESGERDGRPVFRFAAEIFELSLVAAPADKDAGIYRSKEQNMEAKDKERSEEETRVRSIRQAAERFGLLDLAEKAIDAGWSFDMFSEEALRRVGERNNDVRRESPHAGERGSIGGTFSGARISGNSAGYADAMKDYSLTRLLRGIADPKQMPEAELELEVSKRMQSVFGKRSNSICVPFEALAIPQQRAIQVGDANGGSNLKPTNHLGGSFIDILRNRSMVMKLNPTVLTGLQGDLVIPRKTSGATAYWIEGDHDDALTESDIGMDQVSMSPKTVGGAVTFSHKMMLQSSPDVEMMIRKDLADMIAQEIDSKALNGTGANNQPTGIFNQTGIQTKDFAAATPTFEEVCDMEALLASANADLGGTIAWLMDSDMAKALRTTPKQGSGVEGNFVWDSNIGGRVLDIPAYRSNNMPAGFLLLGNWQHLTVGFWGGIEIDADPYGSNFLKGSVTVRVLADIDVAVRHPTAFVSGSDDYT